MRHVLTLFDLSSDEIRAIFRLAEQLKKAFREGVREPWFPGHMMALLFEKPSLRTRVSFETAFAHLGGTTMYLGADVGWGHRESAADFSRVLTQYVDLVVCRAKDHAQVELLAAYAACPVINGLTDLYHPCQALADLLTLSELHGGLADLKLAYIGDANNVARSLAVACAGWRSGSLWPLRSSTSLTPGFSNAWRRLFPATSWNSSRIRGRRSATPTGSTRTCGSAWVRRTSGRRGWRRWLPTRSTPN